MEEINIQSTTMYCQRIHFTINHICSFYKAFKENGSLRNFPITI